MKILEQCIILPSSANKIVESFYGHGDGFYKEAHTEVIIGSDFCDQSEQDIVNWYIVSSEFYLIARKIEMTVFFMSYNGFLFWGRTDSGSSLSDNPILMAIDEIAHPSSNRCASSQPKQMGWSAAQIKQEKP